MYCAILAYIYTTSMDHLTDLEYETQFFGCSSNDVKEGIEGVLKTNIKDSVKDLVAILEINCKDASNETISEIGCAITNLFQTASYAPLKDLEEEINKYFKIPPHVLLEEDAPQQHQYTKEDVEKLDEKLSSSLKNLEVLKYMNAALKEEYRILNHTLEMQTKKLAELEKIIKDNEVEKENLTNILQRNKKFRCKNV